MTKQQYENIKNWFNTYIKTFYGHSDYIDANIKLKDDHTQRVLNEMKYLCDHIDLSENDKYLAYTVALLHDIGRFEQFKQHQTYIDQKSENHCKLGVKVLDQTGILNRVDKVDKHIIRLTVGLHGVKELPGHLNKTETLFCKLVRDADKIDIFEVVTVHQAAYRDDPENFKLEVEYPDEPTYTEEVYQKALAGQKIEYSDLNVWNDMKLLQIVWVYDINLAAGLQRIMERKYLDQMFDLLPDDQKIRTLKETIYSYTRSRIEKNINLLT